MKFWFMPPALYEAWPYICLAIGILALLGVPGIIGKLCGLLLTICGWIIRSLRLDYRSKALSKRHLRPIKAYLSAHGSVD